MVEKWNAFAKPFGKRIDLFGCIDLIACREGSGIVGIQACARNSHAARREKAMAEPRLLQWLKSGGRFEVWSWKKTGARGERKCWRVLREEITLAEYLSENGVDFGKIDTTSAA